MLLHKMKVLIAATITLGIAGCGNDGRVSVYRGGSNYVSFSADPDQNGWSTGVLHNYLANKHEIDHQLEMMRRSGQITLRIIIWHSHGGGPEQTTMDSSGGVLPSDQRENVVAFLAELKHVGFQNLELAFAPWTPLLTSLSDLSIDAGPNYPGRWKSWNERTYQENLQFIIYIRSIVKSMGFNRYYIDLMSEGLPWSSQSSVLQQYCQRLWTDYTAQFGKDDTVGFSLAGQFSFQNSIYGTNPPDVLDVHIYYPPSYSLKEAIQNLHANGYYQPLIIGETWYDDDASARSLAMDAMSSGISVLWLTQWPEKFNADGFNVDTVPYSYSEYYKQGF